MSGSVGATFIMSEAFEAAAAAVVVVVLHNSLFSGLLFLASEIYRDPLGLGLMSSADANASFISDDSRIRKKYQF